MGINKTYSKTSTKEMNEKGGWERGGGGGGGGGTKECLCIITINNTMKSRGPFNHCSLPISHL